MAQYAFRCKNEKCEDVGKEVAHQIPMAEYDIEKVLCEKCEEQMVRIYSAPGIKTFSDGYKG